MVTATAAAPLPTVAAPEPTPAPFPTFSENFDRWWRLLGSLALAGVLIFALLFVALRLLRWFFGWLREFWLTRLRPRLGMAPVAPGIALGEFTEALAEPGYVDSEIVTQTIEESLVRWNRAMPPQLQTPVMLRPLDMVGLGRVSALWTRISTPPRGYLTSGLLLGGEADRYRLAVERLDLRTHRVDASRTFESFAGSSADAFRALAMTAALWLRDPLGMEATPETLAGPSAGAGRRPDADADRVRGARCPDAGAPPGGRRERGISRRAASVGRRAEAGQSAPRGLHPPPRPANRHRRPAHIRPAGPRLNPGS